MVLTNTIDIDGTSLVTKEDYYCLFNENKQLLKEKEELIEYTKKKIKFYRSVGDFGSMNLMIHLLNILEGDKE